MKLLKKQLSNNTDVAKKIAHLIKVYEPQNSSLSGN